MQRFIPLLLGLMLLPLMAFSPSNRYEESFGEAYFNAIDYCKTEKERFTKVGQNYQINPAIISAIVFPELMRYNAFRDFFETEALELAYVKGGSSTADFFIGQFQMKPSFAEYMESITNNDSQKEWAADFQELCSFSAANEFEQRKERLKRLQNKDWQMLYLSAFIKYCQYHSQLKLNSPTQIRWIATRYNCGPQKTDTEVNKWLNKKAFPYGLNYAEAQQFNYSQIALDYYQNIAPQIFNKK